MIKKVYFAIILIFLFILCLDATLTKAWSDFVSKKYHEIVKVEVYSNSILVPVVIGGKTYLFGLDTGASTSISKDLFAELKLSVNDSLQSIDLYGNIKKVYTSTIPELNIGKTRFENFKLSIIRPIQSLTSCGIKIDGYLGNDILSKGVLQIDIWKKEISIANDIDSMDVETHNSSDFKTNNQMIPFLIVSFPGKAASEEVMFDTGSNNYFYRLSKSSYTEMIKNNHLKSQDIIDSMDKSSNSSGAFGKQKEKENIYVNFDSIWFAGIIITNCPAYTLSTLRNSILGAPLLRLGIVTVDYKNHKFYMKRYSDKLVDLSPIHGFTCTSNEKSQLVVESVLKGSIAENENIKTGYILKKLNSTNFDSLTVCERLNFNWSKEYDRDIVRYTFLTMKNEELIVQIRNDTKDDKQACN